MSGTSAGTAVRVAGAEDIPEGGAVVVPRSVTGTGDDIAVFHDGGEYFALDNTCTHTVASLADGWIENGEVECPLHSGRFCLRTGQVQSMPATRDARTHRVEVRDGAIWLYPTATTQEAAR